MGLPDQFLKYTLELEAPQVTREGAAYVKAPEIATPSLTPDGLLRVLARERLRALPAPWPLLEQEAVLEGKMPGDHLDVRAFERCLLRRQARQVQRLEQRDSDPRPSHCAAWILAPRVPEWLLGEVGAGVSSLRALAAGCYSLEPSRFPVVWIAANELPLEDALVPFLVARSGKALEHFVRWAVGRRAVPWLERMVESLPEVALMMPEFKPTITPEERKAVIEGLRVAVEAYPEAAQRFVEKGREEGLEEGLAPLAHQFERRLGRALTVEERSVLGQRRSSLGAERLGDVVLDLSPAELLAWLTDPAAR